MKQITKKMTSIFYIIPILTFSINYINESFQFVIAQSDESLEKMQPIPPSNTTNNQTLLNHNEIMGLLKFQIS